MQSYAMMDYYLAWTLTALDDLKMQSYSLKASSKSANNLLSNDQISNWAVSMMIEIVTKSSHISFTTPVSSIKFHQNLFIIY